MNVAETAEGALRGKLKIDRSVQSAKQISLVMCTGCESVRCLVQEEIFFLFPSLDFVLAALGVVGGLHFLFWFSVLVCRSELD